MLGAPCGGLSGHSSPAGVHCTHAQGPQPACGLPMAQLGLVGSELLPAHKLGDPKEINQAIHSSDLSLR